MLLAQAAYTGEMLACLTVVCPAMQLAIMRKHTTGAPHCLDSAFCCILL